MGIKYNFIKKLYTCNRFTRKIAVKLINRLDGGEFNSTIIRQIYREKYKMEVGICSYGCFSPGFNYNGTMVIGNYCSFAVGVQFIPGNHPMTKVSTHPLFHRAEYGCVKIQKKTSPPILTKVGHDVWIGRNALILPNCRNIGNGAVIGAGAVVTHDVEPYTIVAGNPAKVIRKRFSDDEIEMLESSKWYELSPEKLKGSFEYADDISAFTESLREI